MRGWVGLVLACGAAGLGIWLRCRWLARATAHVESLIRPPVTKFETADDQLRVVTEQRRKAADSLRARAAHVDSGAKVSDVLRIVKGDKS